MYEGKVNINLWNAAVIYKQPVGISISGNTALISVNELEYCIEPESIEEITIYKQDHMSFDTLILQMILPGYVIEIPYEIEFQEYQKQEAGYMIPAFKISPVIKGFIDLTTWLQIHLQHFKSDWLDETQPILDTTNFINAYKKNAPRE